LFTFWIFSVWSTISESELLEPPESESDESLSDESSSDDESSSSLDSSSSLVPISDTIAEHAAEFECEISDKFDSALSGRTTACKSESSNVPLSGSQSGSISAESLFRGHFYCALILNPPYTPNTYMETIYENLLFELEDTINYY